MKYILLPCLIAALLLTPRVTADKGKIYIVRLSNNRDLLAEDFTINEKFDSLTLKSMKTGFTSTLPLERISSIEVAHRVDIEHGAIEIEALFTNEMSIANKIDDGGIPCTFYVTSGTGSGSSRRATSSSKTTSSKRSSSGSTGSGSSNRSSNSSKSSSGSSSSFSTNRNNSSSRSSSSSSGSSADAFMDIFFR